MKAIRPEVVTQCLQHVMRPIARFCVRHGVNVQSCTEAMKLTLIDAAVEDLQRRGERVNVSRLAALTGLHRRDVQRIYADGEEKLYHYDLVACVVGQWQHDPRFLTESGRPRVLSVDGEDCDFRDLMRSIRTDLNSGTVLHELLRTGAAEMSKSGLKLKRKTYMSGAAAEEGFLMLSEDVEDLLLAVEENMFVDKSRPHFHAKTVYDNVRDSELPKIRKWLLKEGANFHRRARNFLSKLDLDINPDEKAKGGVRIAIGSFTRISTDDD